MLPFTKLSLPDTKPESWGYPVRIKFTNNSQAYTPNQMKHSLDLTLKCKYRIPSEDQTH